MRILLEKLDRFGIDFEITDTAIEFRSRSHHDMAWIDNVVRDSDLESDAAKDVLVSGIIMALNKAVMVDLVE